MIGGQRTCGAPQTLRQRKLMWCSSPAPALRKSGRLPAFLNVLTTATTMAAGSGASGWCRTSSSVLLIPGKLLSNSAQSAGGLSRREDRASRYRSALQTTAALLRETSRSQTVKPRTLWKNGGRTPQKRLRCVSPIITPGGAAIFAKCQGCGRPVCQGRAQPPLTSAARRPQVFNAPRPARATAPVEQRVWQLAD